MAESENLSDILIEIRQVVTDTLNYELRLRGIQPAQAPTIKRAQLARELLKEKQGDGYTQWPFMPVTDDLRGAAALHVFFDSTINNATHTKESIEGALINLIFLKMRVDRLRPTTQTEEQLEQMLTVNIENSITKAQDALKVLSEVIDLVGETEPTPNSVGETEEPEMFPLFASMNLNNANEQIPRSSNLFSNENSHLNSMGYDNVLANQSQFSQNVPFSSTNANTGTFPRPNLNIARMHPTLT